MKETTIAGDVYIGKDGMVSSQTFEGATKYDGTIKTESIVEAYDGKDKGFAPLDLTKVNTEYFKNMLKDENGVVYNTDRSAEDKLVKLLFKGATDASSLTLDTNFENVATSLKAVVDADINKGSILNGTETAAMALKAVYGDDMVPGGEKANADVTFENTNTEVAPYIATLLNKDLVGKYNKLMNEAMPIAEAKAEIVVATSAITAAKDANGKEFSYIEPIDSLDVSPVNIDTLDAVKKIYETSLAVYDKYKADADYKAFMDEYDGLNEAINTLYNKKIEDGIIVTVEKAVADKAIIDKLTKKIEDKVALTIEDKVEYSKVVKKDLDKYLTSNAGIAKEHPYADACKAIEDALKGVVAEPTAIAKKHAPTIKAALEAIPTHDTALDNYADTKAKLESAIEAINDYTASMKAAGATESKVINNANSIDSIEKAANIRVTNDAYLVNEGVAESLVNNFVSAAKQVNKFEASAITNDTYKEALIKLAAVIGNTEVVYNNQYEKTKKAIEEFDKAYALIVDENVKAAFDADENNKTAMVQVDDLRNQVVRYENIDKYIEVLDKMVADHIENLPIISDGVEINYASNKTHLDAVDAILKDKNIAFVFERLNKKLVDDLYYALDGTDATAKYAVAAKRYETAKYEYSVYADENTAKTVESKIEALVLLTDKATFADVDAALESYNAVAAAYEALSPTEKAKVSNQAKLGQMESSILDSIVRLINAEMKSLGSIENNVLTTTQIIKTRTLLADLAKYEKVLGDKYNKNGANAATMFVGFDSTARNVAFDAIKLLKDSEKAEANKEIKKVYNVISEGINILTDGDKQINNYGEANKVIAAIEAYNGLSNLAKDLLVNKVEGLDGLAHKTAREIEVLLGAEKTAKSFFLENATVKAIADQKVTGEYIEPTIELTDALGNVIDAKEYVVTYFNNLEVGTAKFVVTAKTDSKYTGTIEGTFNIVAEEVVVPGKMAQPTLDTDFGMIKVSFDGLNRNDVTYRLAYKTAGMTTKYVDLGTDTTYVLTKLKKNALYNVRITARFDGKSCGYSDSKYVYTNLTGEEGAGMNAIKVKATSANRTVKIATTKAGYENVTYRYRIKYDGGNWSRPSDSKSTVKYVKNLKAGRTCTVAVAYYYKSDLGGYVASNYTYAKVRVK